MRSAPRDRGRRFRQCREPAQRLQDHRPCRPRSEPAVSVLTGAWPKRSPAAGCAGGLSFRGGSNDRPAAAQGRLREIALRYSLGETKKADFIGDLEVLTTAWRGDETEVEALQTLARLYTDTDHYRDAFHVMRVALSAYPSSPLTRNIQQEAAKSFDTLFLAGKGDARRQSIRSACSTISAS